MKMLTRIFDARSTATRGKQMTAVSDSNFSSGGMNHTAVVEIHRLPCNHQLRTASHDDVDEISGLNEDLVRAVLAKDSSSHDIEEWIYWNNAPLLHVSEAILQEFFPEFFYQLLKENKSDYRVQIRVNSFLKSKLGWKHSVPWDSDDCLKEVSLITPFLFARLALLAGTLSKRKVIARIIDGSIVRKLHKEIGEDLIEFALFCGSSSKYLFSSLEEHPLIPEDIIEVIKKEAAAIVEAAFSAKSRGVQERIATKYPDSFQNEFYDHPLEQASVAEKILTDLWKEVSTWL